MTLWLNYYECTRCEYMWEDEWDCQVDDDCPHCGCRHIGPYESREVEPAQQFLQGVQVPHLFTFRDADVNVRTYLFSQISFSPKKQIQGRPQGFPFFRSPVNTGFFCPGIRELSRTGTQVHEQGRKNMALERTRTQQDAKETKEYAKGRKNVGVLSVRGG